MIHVAWPDWEARSSWDQAIVLELTADPDYEHGANLNFIHGGVVVLPGQHWVNEAPAIGEAIARMPWALVIVTSDEEALFPVEVLPRDARHQTWGQYHSRPEFDRVIPIGPQPGTQEILDSFGTVARMGDVYFGGQDTHARRHELLAVIKDMAMEPQRFGNLMWTATTGFRQGLSQDRYLMAMRDTRIAPCPSGPHSLDSFRLYEALAAGCIPVVETHTPHGPEWEFWTALFGAECPIPRVESWTVLPALVESLQPGNVWRDARDRIARWYSGYREDLAIDFERTIKRLSES